MRAALGDNFEPLADPAAEICAPRERGSSMELL
jgi:hypothetical protein